MLLAARGAHADDEAELARLRREAEAEFRHTRNGGLLLDHATVAGGGASDPLVAVVELDGVPVGFCEGDELPGKDGSLCRLVSFFVEAGARGVGAGEELMGFVVKWATARGCRGIDIVALPGSREAKNFLEGTGFAARLIVMHRRLDR